MLLDVKMGLTHPVFKFAGQVVSFVTQLIVTFNNCYVHAYGVYYHNCHGLHSSHLTTPTQMI